MRDYAPFLDRVLSSAPEEADAAIEEVRGDLPAWLRGTLYINGPARFSRGEAKYLHWLDGDGMVCAVRFDGEIRCAHRFVRTVRLDVEERAGRPLFRAFGTAFQDDLLHRGVALASPANVSVYPFAGTLLALGEQGLPWELDAATLDTRGPFTFGGALNDVSPFGAHPKHDPETGELINFGVSFSTTQPMLNLYGFTHDATLAWRRRVRMDYPRSIHDFGITKRYLVFYLSPYLLDAAALARRGATVMDALSWRPELGSRLLLVSRATGDAVASIPIGSCYCLHFVNCYDDGEMVVVDVIEYERPLYDHYRLPALFADVGDGRPIRFVVDAARGAVAARRAVEYSLAPDFPAIDAAAVARSYGEFWCVGISATGRPGRKFFDELVRVDWTRPDRPATYRAPAGRFFTAEPALARAPEGADAALLCPMYDAGSHRTEVTVFDPRDVERGPAASVVLRTALPPLFHSSYVPNSRASARLP